MEGGHLSRRLSRVADQRTGLLHRPTLGPARPRRTDPSEETHWIAAEYGAPRLVDSATASQDVAVGLAIEADAQRSMGGEMGSPVNGDPRWGLDQLIGPDLDGEPVPVQSERQVMSDAGGARSVAEPPL